MSSARSGATCLCYYWSVVGHMAHCGIQQVFTEKAYGSRMEVMTYAPDTSIPGVGEQQQQKRH